MITPVSFIGKTKWFGKCLCVQFEKNFEKYGDNIITVGYLIPNIISSITIQGKKPSCIRCKWLVKEYSDFFQCGRCGCYLSKKNEIIEPEPRQIEEVRIYFDEKQKSKKDIIKFEKREEENKTKNKYFTNNDNKSDKL